MTAAEINKSLKYYKGEDVCPYDENSVEFLFWNGERDFSALGVQGVAYFARDAKKRRQDFTGDASKYAAKLNDIQLACVLFIEDKVTTFCPGTNMDWIFKY